MLSRYEIVFTSENQPNRREGKSGQIQGQFRFFGRSKKQLREKNNIKSSSSRMSLKAAPGFYLGLFVFISH